MSENNSSSSGGNTSSNNSNQSTGTTQQPVQPPREFINVNTSENTLANKSLDSVPLTKPDSKS